MAKRQTLTSTMRKPAADPAPEPAQIEPAAVNATPTPSSERKVAPSRIGLRQITMHQSP